ncbi:hypothetical protein D869_gp242 [Caulobacter phage CcrRogue]|uniref:Uncharacterized protein n=1 Tax=Caulobacter phage CcrRogue TaxID=2927986 RepID=K4K367_9CAUD|nr:hypothetical protein D869_gp242 [Caulobacter phage CcrRogue]AFU86672.1 hypothetical protein CcrRogue_gp190 [Caulobacter phage CcrRogue]
MVRQPYAYAREPADIIRDLLALEAAGGSVAMFDKLVSDYRGGSIWPFEYDIVRAIQDLFHGRDAEGKYKRFTADEVKREDITKALEAFDPDNEHYRWPFPQNAQAVYVGGSESFTVGKTYTLQKCYSSQSWNGENCYVAVLNDVGTLSGPGYEQFMLADEYHAIHAARATSSGTLTQLGTDCWTTFPVNEANAHFTDATVARLVEAGAFKDIDDGARRVVRIQDLHWKVKKAKVKRTPAVILADALKRAIEAAESTAYQGASNWVDADDMRDAILDGHFNLEAIAQAVIDDLGLEKHL